MSVRGESGALPRLCVRRLADCGVVVAVQLHSVRGAAAAEDVAAHSTVVLSTPSQSGTVAVAETERRGRAVTEAVCCLPAAVEHCGALRLTLREKKEKPSPQPRHEVTSESDLQR